MSARYFLISEICFYGKRVIKKTLVDDYVKRTVCSFMQGDCYALTLSGRLYMSNIPDFIAYLSGVRRSRRPLLLSSRTHIAPLGPCSTSRMRLPMSKRSTSLA